MWVGAVPIAGAGKLTEGFENHYLVRSKCPDSYERQSAISLNLTVPYRLANSRR